MKSSGSSNKIIKRVLPAAAALLLMQNICGCASQNAKIADDGRPLVVSTIFPGYDFARNIAGDRANVVQLLPFGAESHTFEPTPHDMMLVEKCDVFIYSGGESDEWIEEILSANDNPKRITVSMMDACSVLSEEEMPGMREGGILAGLFEGEEEEEADEHTWTSPKNAMAISRAICDALCAADESNSDFYRDNCTAYTERLAELDARFAKELSECRGHCIVVADRFPFRYMCNEYGLTYRAAFLGCSDNAEITADSMVTLCDFVKDKDIPVVFTIEFSGGKIADRVCEVTGAKRRTLHSCHNVSKTDESYIGIMEQNLAELVEALN